MDSSWRALCKQRSIPIISDNTEKFLSEILEKKKPRTCLEIWSAVAYSTTLIAKKISKRNATLYSFERSYPAYIEGLENISRLSLTNLITYPFHFLKVDIEKLMKNGEKIDFVFIDAQKSQYWDYMMKIRNLLDTSATIIIDDVIKYHHKIYWLYDFLQKNQINYEIIQLDQDDWVILIYK
jgi:predicted O-methyltransferase YrrM